MTMPPRYSSLPYTINKMWMRVIKVYPIQHVHEVKSNILKCRARLSLARTLVIQQHKISFLSKVKL